MRVHAAGSPESGGVLERAPPRVDTLGLVGTVVDGRYRIEAVAGEGGQSIVYRASHLALEVRVALKVLRWPGSASASTAAQRAAVVRDIRTEARILFKMCSLHSSFVQAKDTGHLVTARGEVAPYLVMEWLDGVSLAEEIRASGRRCFSLDDVIRLLDAPSRGLAMAHAHGIVHRDLKPGNLFVTDCDGVSTVRILDFGLAKIQLCGAGTTSNLGNYDDEPRSFTPSYAAPEQWLQRLGATGTWTDVHAWALLCGQLLSGQAPFGGECEEQLMAACLDASHRPTPRALGVQVSREVEHVFARALAIEPRRRFRDIGTFWEALCVAAAMTKPRKLSFSLGGPFQRGPAALEAKRRVAGRRGQSARPEALTLEERTDPIWANATPPSGTRSARPGRLTRSIAILATLSFPNSQTSRTQAVISASVASPTIEIPAAPVQARLPIPTALSATQEPQTTAIQGASKRASRKTRAAHAVAASPAPGEDVGARAAESSTEAVLDRLMLEDGLTRRK